MSAQRTETILSVHHWNESLFSFKTTRDKGFRFESGHFVMVGLEIAGKKVMRAYSISSPSYAEHLEFFSIKVAAGPLTSVLQHIKPGDPVFVSSKPVGTLVVRDVKPGRVLYLLATGTGLAPFLSIVQDPETYERFEKIVLVHGVRRTIDLAYHDFLSEELPANEFFGDEVSAKFLYYPTVTREAFRNTGRINDLFSSGKLQHDLGLPALDPALDRAMICGSPEMLASTSAMLDDAGFTISPGVGQTGDYVIERAFVER